MDLIPCRGDAVCLTTGIMRDGKRPYTSAGADGAAFCVTITQSCGGANEIAVESKTGSEGNEATSREIRQLFALCQVSVR